jgi:hypothetical protein
MRPKLSYANVMSTLCFFLLLGGGAAYAAGHLGKNTVGPKQLKKNAVTTAKVKKEAITAAKVKKGTLTGTQINASTLGTVPNAQSAQVAGTSNALSAPEPWHEVGAPGEPEFKTPWGNPSPPNESVGFYKDHDGIVHLAGQASSGPGTTIFRLPPGFRPATLRVLVFPVTCLATAGECQLTHGLGRVQVYGSGFGAAADGVVIAPTESTQVGLEGITFRAES